MIIAYVNIHNRTLLIYLKLNGIINIHNHNPYNF